MPPETTSGCCSDGVLLDTLAGRATLRGAAVDLDSSDGVLLDTLGGRGTLRGDKANVKSSASRKAVWIPDPKSSGSKMKTPLLELVEDDPNAKGSTKDSIFIHPIRSKHDWQKTMDLGIVGSSEPQGS
ncbi:hypothetical protein CIHG_03150 [Coccidioides immitis H538.4]|uniref:Uncharacterized protein n=1 Tax=Coccidioides immitis H538.4 TaxID=396776 RepID=A0A0J8RL47_COCIT|nr:hypothetical protein CIHG_03150 [Coccidioides immitis H538.4]